MKKVSFMILALSVFLLLPASLSAQNEIIRSAQLQAAFDSLKAHIDLVTAGLADLGKKDSTTFSDTTYITISQWKGAAALTYTSGYIVDTNQNVGGSFFSITAARANGMGGFITAIDMGWDTTVGTGNQTFDILIFRDTVGFGAGLPANNTQYTTNFDMGKFYVGHELVSMTSYGTTGGARGYTQTLIPFKCRADKRSLFFLIIANSGSKPAYIAHLRLRFFFERN